LLAALIGFQVAGLPGALVATVAVCAPSCTLSYLVARVWQRFRDAPWRRAVEVGLAPITIGLMLSSGYLLARGACTGWVPAALTGGATAPVVWARVHPLWLFALGALLGMAGLV